MASGSVVVTGGADRLATAPYISMGSGSGNLIIALFNIPREESFLLPTLQDHEEYTGQLWNKARNVHM